jgi:hypothetical protein
VDNRSAGDAVMERADAAAGITSVDAEQKHGMILAQLTGKRFTAWF